MPRRSSVRLDHTVPLARSGAVQGALTGGSVGLATAVLGSVTSALVARAGRPIGVVPVSAGDPIPPAERPPAGASRGIYRPVTGVAPFRSGDSRRSALRSAPHMWHSFAPSGTRSRQCGQRSPSYSLVAMRRNSRMRSPFESLAGLHGCRWLLRGPCIKDPIRRAGHRLRRNRWLYLWPSCASSATLGVHGRRPREQRPKSSSRREWRNRTGCVLLDCDR
jgi:hypothetical protein